MTEFAQHTFRRRAIYVPSRTENPLATTSKRSPRTLFDKADMDTLPVWTPEKIQHGISQLRSFHRFWPVAWGWLLLPFLIMQWTGKTWTQAERDTCSPLTIMLLFVIFPIVEIVAHSGLQIPRTDAILIEPILPNTCYASHGGKMWWRKVPWPCARDRSLAYIQNLLSGGDIADPEDGKVAAFLLAYLIFVVVGVWGSMRLHSWLRRRYRRWYACGGERV